MRPTYFGPQPEAETLALDATQRAIAALDAVIANPTPENEITADAASREADRLMLPFRHEGAAL